MTDIPVLLVVFNRPDTTQVVFNAIRSAKPSKLYVAGDGPRINNKADIINCQLTREIIKQIDWECEVYTHFLDKNVGCGPGVSDAITWAFCNEDKLIILEDDCVPVQPFFSFCEYLLNKYKDDHRVCMISGNNYTEKNNYTDSSYFFSKYGHIWGWATWKRVWEKYDYHMVDWPVFLKTKQLDSIFPNKDERIFMIKYFDRIYNMKEKGTWDHQWFYCRIKEHGLSILPSHNLVTNIGFQGTHTNEKSNAHLIPVYANFNIINEPKFVSLNEAYDDYHFKNIINKRKSIILRGYNKVLRMLSLR